MERQRNIQQVKEHDKNSPNQTKEEIGKLPEKEFRIMIVKMIQNLENQMEIYINRLETQIEKMQEMFKKDLEKIKNSQSAMNNARNKNKNTVEGTKNRVVKAEKQVSELEYRMVEISRAEERKKKKKRNEDSFRDLSDNVKHIKIRIMGIPGKEDKRKGHEK